MPEQQQLRTFLEHVWHHSPFYRELYRGHGVRESDLPALRLEDLPCVSKETLMAHFDEVVTDSRLRQRDLQRWFDSAHDPRSLYLNEFVVMRSSGGSPTIGMVVYAWRDWQIMTATAAAYLLRDGSAPDSRFRSAFYMMHSRHSGGFTTALHAAAAVHERIFLSLRDPAEEVIARLNTFQPARLTGYASSMTWLAEWALSGELTIAPQQIVVSGDRLTPPMTAKIREAWKAPVLNLYAAIESLFMACQQTGEPHWTVLDELNVLEVLDETNQAVRPGERGRVVLTNLGNYTMPMVRYELDDYAIRGPHRHGHTTLLDVQGKRYDALPIVLDNQQTGTLQVYELATFSVPGVTRVQFASPRPDDVEITYCAEREFDQEVCEAFRRLLQRHGASRMAVRARRVPHLWNSARTSKFRLLYRPEDGLIRPPERTSKTSQTPGYGWAARPSNAYAAFPPQALDASLGQLFERQVAHYPHHIAVRDRAQSVTYAALNRAANRLAHLLLSRQPDSARPVALLLAHGVSMLVAILGVLKAGKYYVPLDPWQPVSRLKALLDDARAACLLTGSQELSMARACAGTDCQIIDIGALDTAADANNNSLHITPDSPACLLYTSGSTGTPKSVLLSHSTLLHRVMVYTNDYHICHSDRLSLLQPYTVNPALRDMFGALLNGAALCLYDLKQHGVDGLAAWLRAEAITVFYTIPSVFRLLLDTLRHETFPHLRLIRLGGEPASIREVQGYRRYFAPPCLLVNALAATETGTICQYFLDQRTPLPGERVPVGYAVADKDILVLDDAGREVPPGSVGEVVVRSRYPAMAHRPPLCATPPPVVAGAEADTARHTHRTGDLGYMLPDGCLVLTGRKDFVVNIRGYRIDVGDVEGALRSLDTVCETAVVPYEAVDGTQYLAAYVVPAARPGPGASELRRTLRVLLPEAMMPSVFVLLDELPARTGWKVNRAALPPPEDHQLWRETPPVAPRNAVEATVAGLWARVLRVAEVGVLDDFFDLGGHSLAAMKIVTQIRKTFDVEFPLRRLFDAATVAEMAAFIAARLRG